MILTHRSTVELYTQGGGAVLKMTLLRHRRFSSHEHGSGSSSGAHGFHECSSSSDSGAHFFHDRAPAPSLASVRF